MPAEVTILGAGPYGLAAAAALRRDGAEVSVIGHPMSFWERMPAGMLLRSPYVASSIGDPEGPLSLDAYATSVGTRVPRPVPLAQFVEYGRWVQERAAPDLDRRNVACVTPEGEAFRLTFEDGATAVTGRLVVAAGIASFPHIPPVIRNLPSGRVSHASNHRDLTVFAGHRILVIGAGQSALESAALLAESGADVEIAARSPMVRWLGRHPRLRSLGPITSLLYAPAEVGPPLLCRVVEAPNLVRRLPAARRLQLDKRSIRPAGAAWLRGRVVDVIPLSLGREVISVEHGDDGLDVHFHDGGHVAVDHILLGTGYRVDLARYPFMSSELLATVRQANGYPELGRGFESSVPGLHFLGAPAAWRFGPLMRFVAGTHFAATELVQALRRRPARERGGRVAAEP